MTLVLVEVANEAAIEKLRLQQDVRVVGVVEEQTFNVTEPAIPAEQPPNRPSVASLIGSLSPEEGQRMLQKNLELRDEWERES